MNKLDQQYQTLLQDILDNGYTKSDRTGTGTLSVFGRQIRHNMKDGFPLLTTKKMAFKTMVTELLWFLRGDTNIKYLVDNNCHIWDGDAYKNYLEYTRNLHVDILKYTIILPQEEFINKIKTDDVFAMTWGELGSIYGAQWRSWRVGKGIETTLKTEDGETIYEAGSMYIDQIANLISELKTNPDSRRMMVNAYNVGELDTMVLPPCHYGFQCYTTELSSQERKDIYDKSNYAKDIFPTDENGWNKLFDGFNIPKRSISLMFNMRSCDIFLGLPFNIASYGLLLTMIADEVNMVPDELIGNLGDTHLYLNHIEQAKEQITREPMKLPRVHVRDGIFCSSTSDVLLFDYESHPPIKAPLSN